MSTLLLRFFCFQRSPRMTKQLLHTSSLACAVEKELLAKLRKQTGFSIGNCKKALEMHQNDIAKAEAWLQAEAQSKGWEKATKLSGRQTSQGLIGIHIEGKTAAMVEVNCETDFVSRNDKFKQLVTQAAKECWKGNTLNEDVILAKEIFSSEQVKTITTEDGKTLGDVLALAIGNIGENMGLPRATRVSAGHDISLVGYCHPSTIDQDTNTGKFGAILAVKTNNSISQVAKQLCVHVIGMNPRAIGSPDDPKAENPEEESLLIHQEFLSDPTRTVAQVLDDEKMEVIDFIRYETGEVNVGAAAK
ncbi:hypothetical protein Pcinc_028389 [Petrolisthes cinctipes]|uniref:Elongation factor Ts, mitochondrial n=1 Tax=Petrolisthes cinctipes TaxID=88211 RepID=A0AAE1K7C5_PETCI|nr:hypothetical protein Pcinc_028389 [Petrolisthes cinctipes]